MYCVPSKQVRLLELIMEFHARAERCIKQGATLFKISSLGIQEKLSRLKGEVKNGDEAALAEFEQGMRQQMDELERSYRTKETLK